VGVGREELGGCFSPFYVMNHFSGRNATRLTFNKEFLLGCLNLREASLVRYFELILLVIESVFTFLFTGTSFCIIYFDYSSPFPWFGLQDYQ